MAYTNIDDPSAYFQTALYTGNNSNNVITNDGNSDLQPDFIWAKSRTSTPYADNHFAVDSSRGVQQGQVINLFNAATNSVSGTDLKSFNTDGFTVGAVNQTGALNALDASHVAWQWKANGGSLTTVGESGANPGFTRQTNTDAGFSIIAYTGTGSNGTIAHGLPSTPEMIIFKRRDATQVWATWHQGIGDDYKLVLNSTDAKDSDGAFMNSTLPTSSNMTVGGASVNTNADGGTYICYAFSPVQGYSKFGTYTGNGNANGTFIYTGFKPAVVINKRTDSGGPWTIFDSARCPNNVNNAKLYPNTADAEVTTTGDPIDFLTNGYKLRGSGSDCNVSGGSYIFMAFAENPFVTSTGIPTTAR